MMAGASLTRSRSRRITELRVDPVFEVVAVAKCGNRPNRKIRILSAHNLRKTSAIRIMVGVAAVAVEVEVVVRVGEVMVTVAEDEGVDIMMMAVTAAAVEEAVEATMVVTEEVAATVVVVEEISHGEMGRTTTVTTQIGEEEVEVVVVTIEDAVVAILAPLETLWPTSNVSKNPENPASDSRRMISVEGPFDRTEDVSGDEAFSGEGDGFVQVSSPLKSYIYLLLSISKRAS